MEVLTLIIKNPLLLRACGPEELDVLSTVSRSIKNKLADAFLAIFLQDQLSQMYTLQASRPAAHASTSSDSTHY